MSMAVNISPVVCPPLPPPSLEYCHRVTDKYFVVQHMNAVSQRRNVYERPDDKTVVHRCIASLMSSPAYALIDIYPIDTVLPIHIAWHHEATAKSTTQDGGMAETYICGRKLRLMHLYRSVDVST